MIRQKLIEARVKNLKEFGYEYTDTENILTDEIYSVFFLSMLNDNKGHRADIDKEIDTLISEISK